MADRSGYIGRAPGDSSVVVARQTFSPTGIQTDFTFASGYVVGYLDLYLNGARLIEGQDFTATDGSVVGLTTYAQNGDVLELVAYKAFNATNVQSAGGDFSVGANLSVTGTLTVGGVEVQPGAAGTWASYDSNTGISTTKKVKVDNDFEVTGVGTFASRVSIGDSIFHVGDDNTAFGFPAADTFTINTNGSERVRVDDSGRIIGGHNSTVGTLYKTTYQAKGVGSDHSAGYSVISGNDELAGAIVLDASANNGIRIDSDPDNARADSYIRFRVDASEKVRITSAGVVITGIATATSFSGDGSNLTGVGGELDVTASLFI